MKLCASYKMHEMTSLSDNFVLPPHNLSENVLNGNLCGSGICLWFIIYESFFFISSM